MQSKAPSVTGDAKRWQKTRATSGFAIQCQAQGHPVPMFRYIHFPLPFERERCCRRAVGSEGAEILERRPRELVRSRRGRIVDVALPSPRVPSSVVQVKETKDSSFESPSIARTLRSRARGIQGARLPERRQKRHLRESSEILGRDHLRRSGIASPDSQVILLLLPFLFLRLFAWWRVRKGDEGEESPPVLFVRGKEPAGRVSPKFPKSAKSDAFEVASGAVLSLLCDAQAFPGPAFRSVNSRRSSRFILRHRACERCQAESRVHRQVRRSHQPRGWPRNDALPGAGPPSSSF